MVTPFNFDPFFSRTVGFERIFDRLNLIAEDNAATPSYPPYNIIRHSDDKFDIEIAVAGFKEEELNVHVAPRRLHRSCWGRTQRRATQGSFGKNYSRRNET